MLKPLFALALIAGTQAGAATFEAGYAGCLTEDQLDEFTMALANKDNRQLGALLGIACVAVGGFEYSVVDRGFLKSQVRVYVGADSILLWVPSEAAR